MKTYSAPHHLRYVATRPAEARKSVSSSRVVGAHQLTRPEPFVLASIRYSDRPAASPTEVRGAACRPPRRSELNASVAPLLVFSSCRPRRGVVVLPPRRPDAAVFSFTTTPTLRPHPPHLLRERLRLLPESLSLSLSLSRERDRDLRLSSFLSRSRYSLSLS